MSLTAASSTADAWLLVAPDWAEDALAPLIAAHRRRRAVIVRRPAKDALADLANVAGAMMVCDARATPRSALASAFAVDGDRQVPVGVLPASRRDGLADFVAAAVAVHARRGPCAPVALLGQWDDAALRTAQRSAELISDDGGLPPGSVCVWTADRIVRRDLLGALRLGPALALYFGHGRAYGWTGYHGLHTRHLVHARGAPVGAMISLTCSTAARPPGRRAFSERIVLDGIAPVAFGAVRPTRTTDNWRWGLSISRILAAKRQLTLGALLSAALPSDPAAWPGFDAYRIIGDPLTPLRGASGAVAACAGIWAPGPGDSPTPPRPEAPAAAWLAD